MPAAWPCGDCALVHRVVHCDCSYYVLTICLVFYLELSRDVVCLAQHSQASAD